MDSDEEYQRRAIPAGAEGYLRKDSTEPARIASHVRKIRTNGLRAPYDALGERERKVLQNLAHAKTSPTPKPGIRSLSHSNLASTRPPR